MSRTVLLTRRFPPQTCGVGDYTLRLAESLTRQGEQVAVFTGLCAGPRPAGIRVVESAMSGWRDLRPLLRAIKAEHPDRVQLEYSGYGWSRWGFSFWLNALFIALGRRGVPVALALHEVPIRMRQHPLQFPIIVLQWLHTVLLVAAAESVALNMLERVRLLRRVIFWRRGRIFYRPNSSTIPVVQFEAEQRRALRAAHGVSPEDRVVATFGLFQRDKNFESVIEAVAQARAVRPLKLWLLGDPSGSSQEYLERLRQWVRDCGIEPHVFWSARLDRAGVSAHLQAADFFVLPQQDGHLTRSSAFMAAAAHGLPVIAVRNLANQQEFTHGRDVWLTERSSSSDFAPALEEFLGDPQLPASLGRNLRKLYQEEFDWTVVTRSQGGVSCAPAISEDTAGRKVNLEET